MGPSDRERLYKPLASYEEVVDDYVIAQYRFRFRTVPGLSFLEMVQKVARITSVSVEAPLIYAPEAQLDAIAGRVVRQTPLGAQTGGEFTEGLAEIAFRAESCCLGEGLPLLVSFLTYISVYDFVEEFELLHIALPASLLSHFRGPRSGIAGILNRAGRSRGPLVGLILKPRRGLDPLTAGALAFDAASGGIDYVIDDELLVDPPDCRFATRVNAVVAALRRASAEGGGPSPLYIANVTAEHRKMWELVRIAASEGVDGVMVNPICMGFDVLRQLSESRRRNLFLVANTVGRGVYTRGTGFRISDEVLCWLCRVAGADAVYTGPISGALRSEKNTGLALASELRRRLGAMPAAAAVASGGLGLWNVINNTVVFGENLMIQMGQSLCEMHDQRGGVASSVRTIRHVLDLFLREGEQARGILVREMDRDAALATRLRRLGWPLP